MFDVVFMWVYVDTTHWRIKRLVSWDGDQLWQREKENEEEDDSCEPDGKYIFK